MDKRTILFIIVVSLAFMGVNFYFSHERDKNNRELLIEAKTKESREKLRLAGEAQARTAPLESLPIVEIYADAAGEKRLAYGIDDSGQTLSLSWAHPLPRTVYTKERNNTRLREQTLLTEQSVVGGPVVFATKGFDTLSLAGLPELGTYDLQLITFNGANPPQVALGIYHDGNLSVPAGTLHSNALALYKTDFSGYLPFGFYESLGGLFVRLQELPLLNPFIETAPALAPKAEGLAGEQKYYVLENEYQQFVFTNVGGALSEINLPFESSANKKSVVKEIGFDRDIAEKDPANAHFPAHPYYAPGSKQEAKEGKLGGYYPLIRRDIMGKNGEVRFKIAPQYYAYNIVSDYPEMAQQMYEVKEFTSDRIVFESVQALRKITKIFSLKQGDAGAPYVLDLAVKIEGDSRGLWLTSGVPEVELMSGSSSPQIQYRITRGTKSEVEKLDLPKPKEVITVSSVSPDWVVNSNGYLGLISDPLTEIGAGYRAASIAGTAVPTRLSVIDPQYEPYKPANYPGYQVLLPLPTRGSNNTFRVYAGPFEESTLKAVDKYFSDPAAGYTPDYIASRTFYGWFSFISEPFAKLLFIVMKFFYTLTHSWALAIILLTVFLRVLLYPLNAWSFKSMRRMQKISPEVQAIQAKYKKDPKKSQMEIMKLYREKKVNPFTGCLPILIQIPFLIGMFDLLKSSFQLRGAGFIPGWIDNLTAPDVLFQWSRPIFFIGTEFHLLPIILGLVMFFQQRMGAKLPADKSKWTDQQRQQRAMGNIMTVVFAVMFYNFPSGLNLYWLSSMLLGMLQQWFTNKTVDKENEVTIVETKKAKN